MIKKVERDTLNERVYEELRGAIVSGRFPPGTNLTLRGLAEIVGTSEMPVRDAVRRLVVERALESLPNRSVVVPILSEDAYREISEIRLRLETLATRYAAENLTEKDIKALRTNLKAMAASKTHSQYLKLNREFHFRIYEAARRPLLLSIIELLWVQTGPLLNVVELGAGKTEAHSHHSEVVKALAKGDADAAAKEIAADIEGAAVFIANWMKQQAS